MADSQALVRSVLTSWSIGFLFCCAFFLVFSPICQLLIFFFFFQAEDGIRDVAVTGVQTCALPIYLETHAWLQVREDFGVLSQLEPQPRRPDVVAGTPTDPPAGPQLSGGDQDRRQHHARRQRGHARPPARNAASRPRRSTYGSLRYTKRTHVTLKSSTMATPAPASPPRLRTSRPSLNQSSSASTGSAPSVARGTT